MLPHWGDRTNGKKFTTERDPSDRAAPKARSHFVVTRRVGREILEKIVGLTRSIGPSKRGLVARRATFLGLVATLGTPRKSLEVPLYGDLSTCRPIL